MLHRHLSNFGEKFNCDAQVLDFGVPSHVPSSGLLKHYCLQSVANFTTNVGNPGLLLSAHFIVEGPGKCPRMPSKGGTPTGMSEGIPGT
jgi:hypothetical protein